MKATHDYKEFAREVDPVNCDVTKFHEIIHITVWVPIYYITDKITVASILHFNRKGFKHIS